MNQANQRIAGRARLELLDTAPGSGSAIESTERVQKIERNMRFVCALEAQLQILENRAASQHSYPEEAVGIRTAITSIRKVIDEHVD